MQPIEFDRLFNRLPTFTQSQPVLGMFSLVNEFVPLVDPKLPNVLRVDYTLALVIRTEKLPFVDGTGTFFVPEKVGDKWVMKVSHGIDIVRDIKCDIPHHVEIDGIPISGKTFAVLPESEVTIVFDMPEEVPTALPIAIEGSIMNVQLWQLFISSTKPFNFAGNTYRK